MSIVGSDKSEDKQNNIHSNANAEVISSNDHFEEMELHDASSSKDVGVRQDFLEVDDKCSLNIFMCSRITNPTPNGAKSQGNILAIKERKKKDCESEKIRNDTVYESTKKKDLLDLVA